jgi:hypothetical protein
MLTEPRLKQTNVGRLLDVSNVPAHAHSHTRPTRYFQV